jgi:predicted acetyltransferase
MIRHASEGDIIQLKSLWDQSFNDPLSYIDFIYNNVARPADTLVYDSGDNTLAAMMTLVPTNFVFQDKAVRTMYVYGAATDRRYQRQGIMTAMLRYAEEYAKNLEFLLSVLVPGERHLFDYYRGRGYGADFNCRVLNLKPGMISPDIIPENDCGFDTITAAQFYGIRHAALSATPHVEWNIKQLEFVFADLKIYGEHIAHYQGRYGESYAVYGVQKKKMHIKECMGSSDEAVMAVIKDVIQQNDPKAVTLQLPMSSKLFGRAGKVMRYGMAKPLQVHTSIKDMEPYMNLMLD